LTKLPLEIELVPATCFFSNVRSAISASQWKIISKQVRAQAYNICEICQSSLQQPLHCHEVWEYNDTKQIQKLIKMVALCRSCHQVKHFGLARVQGKEKQAIQHFIKVNKISGKLAEKYIEQSFIIWRDRSSKEWTLDISILNDYGVDITKIRKPK